MTSMKVYLVGGAVRDHLLGINSKDRDWVVVGETPSAMKARGFKPVGKDFPVFLHPDTHEEYALARTERKSGHGYGGFTFHASPDITLEEDLIRRDLTINAMAKDDVGNIIDPYGGQTDITNKKLRHVSAAFEEDPLRVLRVARFAARFHTLGFTIADETKQLMQHMVDSGEVSHLVPERVWQETVSALKEPCPTVYFDTLIHSGALAVVWPLLNDAFAEKSPALQALASAANARESAPIRFACLFPTLPTFTHKQLAAFFKQRRLPNAFAEAGLLVNKHLSALIGAQQGMEAEHLVDLFECTDAFRKPERFINALHSSYHLAQALGENLPSQQIPALKRQLDTCRTVDAKPIVADGYKGKAIAQQVRLKRIQAIQSL